MTGVGGAISKPARWLISSMKTAYAGVFPEHRRLNRGFFYPVVLFRGHCCASPRHFRYGCSADAHGSLYLAPTRSAAQLSGDASVAVDVLRTTPVSALGLGFGDTLSL